MAMAMAMAMAMVRIPTIYELQRMERHATAVLEAVVNVSLNAIKVEKVSENGLLDCWP
jgi:hypothetical protein